MAGLLPILSTLGGRRAVTVIPVPLWLGVYAVFLAALAICTIAVERLPSRVTLPTLALTVVSGLAIVTTAPRAPWLPMILICTAIACSYLIPLWATLCVVGVNTAAVTLSGMLGDMSWRSAFVSAAIYLVIQLSGVLTVRLVIRENGLRRELLVAHNTLKATQNLLEESSRSQERLRISRDLHDVLGHHLTALSLELEAAGHLAEEPARQHVLRARAMAKDMLSDVRSTVGSLREQDEPVRLALEDLVDGIEEPVVHLSTDLPETLDRRVATAIVRTVQEGLTNAIRHADAESIWIDVTNGGGRIDISIRDDGRGAAVQRPGNGLAGMRERIAALGGEVEFNGSRGFAITGWVPA